MNIVKHFLSLIGAVSLGTLGGYTNASAQEALTFAEYQKKAEIECERALEEDTIEALEEYLRNYRFADTACLTLALNAAGDADGSNPGGPGDGYGG